MSTDPSRITLSTPTVNQIAELLEFCDRFVRETGPAVRAALAAQLPDGYRRNLLIDDLGFTAAYLRDQLAAAQLRHATTAGQR